MALEGLDESSQDHGGRQSKNPEANVPHLREFMKFSMRWDRRVFIGGSHGLSPVIELIRDKVQRLGYEPILAADFYQPREITIYHKCLALLHSCKYAVIDLSEHAGQLLELERTHEYGVRPLVLWPKNKTSAISQMLTSVFRNRGIKYQSYENYDELDNLLREFFHGDAIF